MGRTRLVLGELCPTIKGERRRDKTEASMIRAQTSAVCLEIWITKSLASRKNGLLQAAITRTRTQR